MLTTELRRHRQNSVDSAYGMPEYGSLRALALLAKAQVGQGHRPYPLAEPCRTIPRCNIFPDVPDQTCDFRTNALPDLSGISTIISPVSWQNSSMARVAPFQNPLE